MDDDPLPRDHPETERVSTGALPPDTDVQALICAGYERFRHLGEGAVADYIPALAAASPSAFGVCVAGVHGRLFSVGDADQEFAIESILTLRQTAGNRSLTRHCPTRFGISARSACVYCLVVTERLLQPPAAQELLAWR